MKFDIDRLAQLSGLLTESHHNLVETHKQTQRIDALDEARLRRFIRQELQVLLGETGYCSLSKALASGQVHSPRQSRDTRGSRGPGRTIGFFGPGF